MRLDEYQKKTQETAIYPGAMRANRDAVTYTVLGLASEAGEVAGAWKKVLRDDDGQLVPATTHRLGAELADVLWYVARAADELGFSLSELADQNLRKLGSRASRGVLGGSGDDR